MNYKELTKDTIEQTYKSIVGQKFKVYVEHYGHGDNPAAVKTATDNFMRGVKKAAEAAQKALEEVEKQL